MDSIIQNEDKNINIESRWDRIEKRHINSTTVYNRTESAAQICNDLIENREFVNENHLKMFLGEKSSRLCLDPNVVMDLRHSKVSTFFHSICFDVFFFFFFKHMK